MPGLKTTKSKKNLRKNVTLSKNIENNLPLKKAKFIARKHEKSRGSINPAPKK